MADKTYKLTFAKSDGTSEDVQFTAPQGPKGDTGAAGVGIAIMNTTKSADDDGYNTVTFGLTDGTSKTFTVKNGSKGADGYSPVRGTDYWTDADQEAIVQQVIAALGTPVFGVVDADNNIILSGELPDGTYTLKYEDADGEQTEIGMLSMISYINQIPISADTDGSVYNGTGYKTETRGNSSGDPADCTGGTNPPFFTGFIPCKQGDVIRLKNCYIHGHDGTGDCSVLYGTGSFGIRFGVYDSSKTKIAVESWGNLNGNKNVTDIISNYTRVTDADNSNNGKIYEFTVAYAGTAYIRLTLAADKDNGFTPADAIVTVNQEIGE